MKVKINKEKLRFLLRLISEISQNHHRFPYLITKIEHILNNFFDIIKTTFSSYEIFDLFKNNKRIILFLLKENVPIYASKKSTDQLYNINPVYLLCAISYNTAVLYHISDCPIYADAFNAFIWKLNDKIPNNTQNLFLFMR